MRIALITPPPRSGASAPIGLLAALLAAAACGDNSSEGACEPPADELPTEGPLRDPLALPLADCVPGGLRDLPGRWFLAASGPGFTFEYPRFEGSCEAGLRRALHRAEDHDASDGRAFHTWSDGTRIFLRSYRRFLVAGQAPFERVTATVACMRPDGTLTALRAFYTTDDGARSVPMTGRRFGPKDGSPRGLALVGELGAQSGEPMPAYNLVVDGSLAYLVGPQGLDVVDVSVPSAPAHRGHLDGGFNDVRVVRGGGKIVAYASPLSDANTAIIDVTDPAHPTQVGELPEYSHSVQIAARGGATFLYLATYTSAVPKYDVTNPLAPARLGEATVPGPDAGVHDLTVDGDRIYANNTTQGMVALDVGAGLGAAAELGRFPSAYSHAGAAGTIGGRPVLLHGDEGMTSAGGAYLSVLDADPASPTFLRELGRYQSRPEVGIHNIELVGDKAYLSYYQDGVRVVDLSTPSAPREIAHYNTWREETAPGDTFEGAIGIRVIGPLIYIADAQRGLLILRDR